MSQPAQTLVTTAEGAGYGSLDDRSTLLALCGLYGASAGLTAQQAVTQAAAASYGALSDLQLTQALLAVLS